MAVPPCYADIGKSAKDLFSKGFNYGGHKLEFKSQTASGPKFTTCLKNNTDTGKSDGHLETEYKVADRGLTFKEKWSTDNTLTTDLTIEDEFVKGLKIVFDTEFKPHTGYKHAKLKTSYKQEYIHANCDIDLDFAGPIVHGAAVTGYKGWIAGYQMSFDTAKSKLTKNNFAVGHVAGDYALSTTVNDGNVIAASYSHKLSPTLEAAAQISLTTVTNAVTVGLAGKYALDKETVVRAKVNDAGQVGLSYQQDLKKGITLNLSTLIEATNLNGGGHKIGLGLDLAA